MALTPEQRQQVANKIMKTLSAEREPISILKSEVRTVVDAVDDWVEANRTSYNLAIPQPARAELTAEQKARFLAEVVMKRFRD
jgi:PHD/YefM family antitoxin component YafN of YafNO toxin-antitoxin module